ncbi:hypothetical protein [Okeania hirsuta]|uniref:hypothetical protein n=1 Tax=Okeania hirsuta TaxID=1458930 RepID=UPI001961C953|nr:hypothetical protein [Okeania hirsuta]
MVIYEIEQDSINFDQILLTELTLLRRYAKQVELQGGRRFGSDALPDRTRQISHQQT